MVTPLELLHQGIAHKRQGAWQQAVACYEQAVNLQADFAEAHFNLGILWRDIGRLDQALQCLERAWQLRPDVPQIGLERANLLVSLGDHDAAITELRDLLTASPRFAAAWFNLGAALLDRRQWSEAAAALEQAVQLEPDDPAAWSNLGAALREQHEFAGAEAAWRESLRLDPRQSAAWTNLGALLRDQGRVAEAVTCHEQALAINPQQHEAHLNLANARHQLDEYAEAISHYDQARRISPECDEAWLCLGNLLREIGDLPQARRVYTEYARQRPADPLARLRRAVLCPPVFDSREEIAAFREELQSAMAEVPVDRLRWELDRFPQFAVESPFLLQFLEGDLRPWKEALAGLYVPYFARHQVPLPPRRRGARPRIGIVVATHRASAFLPPFGGIVRRLDAKQLEVLVLCSAPLVDELRAGLAGSAVAVRGFPERLAAAREVIRDSQCDLLYYWEVGNHALNYFLPFLRLAPVQVTSWGIQVTSGIPNLDAYLSSHWIEPPGAESHYSERLLLGSTLLNYREPVSVSAEPLPRSHFGIPPRAHVYGCVQNLGKFHPDFDHTLGEILRTDSQGVLVVGSDPSGFAARLLRRRWERTLPEVLNRIVFTPALRHQDYLRLLAQCDVLLDPPYFGGVTTTYDALSLGLPIVTRPAEYERGRYTSGLLRRLGVTTTIAADEADYVRRAVELGANRELRESIRLQIEAVRETAFHDLQAVREHEQMFLQLLAE